MTIEGKKYSVRRISRIAGLLYLLIFIISPFSFFFVRSSIIVPGDATATAANLTASESLFRMGIAGDSLVFLSEIAIISILYVLFRPVSRTLALVAVFSRLAMAVMQGINLLNYFIPLRLLSGADFLSAFDPGELHAFVLLFLDAYEDVALVWGTFFGLHLLVLGYLVFRSGYFPRVLGLLLALSALGYLIDSFGNFLLPRYEELFASVVLVLAIPGELSLHRVAAGERGERRAVGKTRSRIRRIEILG